jgi:hypothetical protein
MPGKSGSVVENLQFAAVAAYLLWCLFASLSGVIGTAEDGIEPEFAKATETQQSGSARRTMGCAGAGKGVR